MKSLFTVTFILLLVACANTDDEQSYDPCREYNVQKKRIRDSLYYLYFGCNGVYTSFTQDANHLRIAGSHTIPITKYCGKSSSRPLAVELKYNNGYYFDTVEAGVVHQYLLGTTNLWVNSASLIAFSPSGDTIKLCGEGYFETCDKPLTILVDDTVSILLDKKSSVNIEAYKTAQDCPFLKSLAVATILKGRLIVINGSSIDTVTSQLSRIFINSGSDSHAFEADDKAGVDSWTKLEFNYTYIDINDLVKRLGRRYNCRIETAEDSLRIPISISANFDEPLRDILKRLDTLDKAFRCRLVNNNIVVTYNHHL